MDKKTRVETVVYDQLVLYMRGLLEATRREGAPVEPYTFEDGEELFGDFSHLGVWSTKEDFFQRFYNPAMDYVNTSFFSRI
ncbi:hypothetical protein COW46_00795 [Candidatus Gracilibacteria bacterium CG17_big_fil_post_rev_8_21_14_2_50_48_13]|nr:MAG: hypothetical protein COW46_00795 [Candidatus Gracilibacteria bacterium CG17_big_fil_post_rev_8_21_14_2_50_48_13]